MPTIGMEVTRFVKSNLQYFAMDVSGQSNARSMWIPCLHDSAALVIVIDSTDKHRLSVLKDEIAILLKSHPDSTKLPILFLANKMDAEGALKPAECVVGLGLDRLKKHNSILL